MTIFYCVEDQLSRAVALRLISEYFQTPIQPQELGMAFGGFGHIKKNIRKYHDLSLRYPVLIITDLDREECPPNTKKKMDGSRRHY